MASQRAHLEHRVPSPGGDFPSVSQAQPVGSALPLLALHRACCIPAHLGMTQALNAPVGDARGGGSSPKRHADIPTACRSAFVVGAHPPVPAAARQPQGGTKGLRFPCPACAMEQRPPIAPAAAESPRPAELTVGQPRSSLVRQSQGRCVLEAAASQPG